MTKKKSLKSIKPHELAERLHEIFEQEKVHKLKRQQRVLDVIYKLRRAVTIPIIIGVFAAVLMWWKFGLETLAKTLLSWTIGLTILVAIVTLLQRVDRV